MQTITMKRNAQRTFSLQEWMNAKSETFSTITGEECTHKEVIAAHLVFLGFIILCLMGCMLEGGAA